MPGSNLVCVNDLVGAEIRDSVNLENTALVTLVLLYLPVHKKSGVGKPPGGVVCVTVS